MEKAPLTSFPTLKIEKRCTCNKAASELSLLETESKCKEVNSSNLKAICLTVQQEELSHHAFKLKQLHHVSIIKQSDV